MLLLALDTSAAVGAALHDGSRVLAHRSAHDPRRHAELLAPFVVQVLADADAAPGDVTAVAVGVGPGPFTGLRVGLVTAQTLGLALSVPVYGVCSLDALAAEAFEGAGQAAELVAATDARRREVYWARYRRRGPGVVRVDGPHVGGAAGVPVGQASCVGRGARIYPDALPGPDDGPLDPSAAWVASLAVAALAAAPGAAALADGPGATLMPVEPLYLRRPDAQEPGARKRVLT